MSHLDNRTVYKQLDTQNIFDHFVDAPEQLLVGWQAGAKAIIPAAYSQAKNVTFIASPEDLPMIETLALIARETSRVPVTVLSAYDVPHWLNRDSLLIAVDYSGNSEQVVSVYEKAVQQGVRALTVSVGGLLASAARRYKLPFLTLEYGAPARFAFYHTFPFLCALLKKLDLVDIQENQVREASVLLNSLLQNMRPETSEYENNTKQLAVKIANRQTVIVGSGNLAALAKRWQFQFASTSKMATSASSFPVFNQTLINAVGLTEGKPNQQWLGIILQSKYDSPRNKFQQTLAYQIFQARRLVFEPIFMHPSGSAFGEIVLTSLYGDLTAYYLAILTGNDPAYVEAGDYVTEHLQREERN